MLELREASQTRPRAPVPSAASPTPPTELARVRRSVSFTAVSDRPVFYYELQSPYSWLAAERINQVLPETPVWKPVSYGHIVAHTGVLPWSFNEDRSSDFDEIAKRAKE